MCSGLDLNYLIENVDDMLIGIIGIYFCPLHSSAPNTFDSQGFNVCMHVFNGRERTDCPKKTILGRQYVLVLRGVRENTYSLCTFLLLLEKNKF